MTDIMMSSCRSIIFNYRTIELRRQLGDCGWDRTGCDICLLRPQARVFHGCPYAKRQNMSQTRIHHRVPWKITALPCAKMPNDINASHPWSPAVTFWIWEVNSAMRTSPMWGSALTAQHISDACCSGVPIIRSAHKSRDFVPGVSLRILMGNQLMIQLGEKNQQGSHDRQ